MRSVVLTLVGEISNYALNNLWDVLKDNVILADKIYSKENFSIRENIGNVVILICSYGGKTLVGVEMYELLKKLRIELDKRGRKLITVNIGFVESAAILPFMAGSERISGRNSIFLIHNSTIQVNKYSSINECTEAISTLSVEMSKYLESLNEATNYKNTDLFARMLKSQKIFNGNYAYELGIVSSLDICPKDELNNIHFIDTEGLLEFQKINENSLIDSVNTVNAYIEDDKICEGYWEEKGLKGKLELIHIERERGAKKLIQLLRWQLIKKQKNLIVDFAFFSDENYEDYNKYSFLVNGLQTFNYNITAEEKNKLKTQTLVKRVILNGIDEFNRIDWSVD